MLLTLDIGNTRSKYAIWNGTELVASGIEENCESILKNHPISGVCISNVSSKIIPNLNIKTVLVSAEMVLPFTHNYKTPKTLGSDRIACLAGAISEFPSENVLIIDAGTCLKFDVITSEKKYLGGAISPGLSMRLNALHTFTGKLPLLSVAPFLSNYGNSTEECMQSGSFWGMLAEINGRIKEIKEEMPELKIIITGGDTSYFVEQIKCKIFANPLLMHKGLMHLFNINQ